MAAIYPACILHTRMKLIMITDRRSGIILISSHSTDHQMILSLFRDVIVINTLYVQPAMIRLV